MSENNDDEDIQEEINEDLSLSSNNNSLTRIIQETIVGNERENKIREKIIKKLILFYQFNNKIKSIINSKNNNVFSYNKYCIVKPNWMAYFLIFHNYHDILPIIINSKNINNINDMNNENITNICRNINNYLRKHHPKKEILNNIDMMDKLNTYLRSENNFFPEEIKIIEENNNNKFTYYNEFIILDKISYDEIKDDFGITHNFQHDPKTANIFIFGNNFIYKIKDNIFGLGTFLNVLKMPLDKLIVLIIIITDKMNNNAINIIKSKNIINYIKSKINNNNFDVEIFKLYNQNHLNKINFQKSSEDNCNDKQNLKDLYNYIIKDNNSYYIKKDYNINNNTDSPYDYNGHNNITNVKEKSFSSNITNINEINDFYEKEKTVGDGNCLFYSFSQLIFNDDLHSNTIRQKICDYIQNNSFFENYFENKEEKLNYINRMRKDKEYGGEYEIQAFAFLCDIRLMVFIKEIDDNFVENEQIKILVYNHEKDGNMAIILDKYSRSREGLNHYSSLKCKAGMGITNEKLRNIKEILLNQDKNNSNQKESDNIFKYDNNTNNKSGDRIFNDNASAIYNINNGNLDCNKKKNNMKENEFELFMNNEISKIYMKT